MRIFSLIWRRKSAATYLPSSQSPIRSAFTFITILASPMPGIEPEMFIVMSELVGVPVPAIAPPVGWLEDAGFAAHRWLAWALLALVALHVAGAVKRQVLDRDGTLARMLGKRRH